MRLAHLALLLSTLLASAWLFTAAVVSAQATATDTATNITITLPPVEELVLERIVVVARAVSPGDVLVTLVAYFNGTDVLPILNVRVVDNSTGTLFGSMYYLPNATCFDVGFTAPPDVDVRVRAEGIHYGRWVVAVKADVVRVEVYEVYNCTRRINATCPGTVIASVAPCSYEYVGHLVVVMPPLYQFPPEVSGFFASLATMFLTGVLFAAVARGDARIMGLGMVAFGTLVIPYLSYLGITVPHAPAISVVLTVFGLLILWYARG